MMDLAFNQSFGIGNRTENHADGIRLGDIGASSTYEETITEEWKNIDLCYIVIVIILGTFGNLIVIFSIIVDKKTHSCGNIFVINLAAADFVICAVPLPTAAATIIIGHRIINDASCQALGYLLNSACVCSIANMTLIAVNRYCAVLRVAAYRRWFTKKFGIYLVVISWIYSMLINLPTLLGWGKIAYDDKSLVCGWHDLASLSFAVFLITTTIFIPLGIIVYCYYQVCRKVRSNGKWLRSLGERHILSQTSASSTNDSTNRSIRRERRLAITLLTAAVVFFVCWTPYAIHVLVASRGSVTAQAKKVFVWLALTNSCLNFVIYGVLNPSFKRRYKKFFRVIFHCQENRSDESSRVILR